ncbi:MAG: hypothetical protein KF803_12140 [Cyclobacteriaceae bacterium]|nr:hypothetical protein [Cyclobacteriaceae bacterium]
MKTNPKPLKSLLIGTLLLLVACANPLSTTHMLSVEEQCLVLHEKRTKAPKPGARPKSFSSREIKLEAFPVVQHQTEMLVESIRLRPFPVEELYASIAEPEFHLAIQHAESMIFSESAPHLETASYEIEPKEATGELVILPASTETSQSRATENSFLTNNSVPIMMGASGLFSLLMLSLAQSRSKKISYWAAENPWKARGLIAGTHVITGLSALTLGHHLYDQQVFVSDTVSYAALSVFTTSYLLYPFKNSAFSFTHSYFAQKANDIALFTSGAVMMLYAGNHYHLTQQPVVNSEVVYSFTSTNASEKSLHLVKNKKELRKEKRELQQEVKKELSGGAKAALTLLVLMTFVVAIYGLAALSCSIACSGNEGLAAVVGIGGGIGLIALLVLAFRGIYGDKRKSKKVREATEA